MESKHCLVRGTKWENLMAGARNWKKTKMTMKATKKTMTELISCWIWDLEATWMMMRIPLQKNKKPSAKKQVPKMKAQDEEEDHVDAELDFDEDDDDDLNLDFELGFDLDDDDETSYDLDDDDEDDDADFNDDDDDLTIEELNARDDGGDDDDFDDGGFDYDD
mmetsp:Transcript_25006/g.51681  ORF Transcript_25006/g.51681 Transcript_25006/m.51681 type:complete len:163 (+) Transcript_25006:926-1414(+)